MKEILKEELNKLVKSREKIIFKIEGISPLLLHNPSSMMGELEMVEEKGDKKKKGSDIGVKRIPIPEEEARQGLYIDKENNFYIPAICFHNCIANAAKGKRIGKVSAPSIVWGAINVYEEKCILIDPEKNKPLKDYEIDIRTVVVGFGKNSKRIIRARPKFLVWGCYVKFEYDWEVIDPKVILQLMQIGGNFVGVGDYRPQTRGPFGRFKVVEVYEE